METSLTTEVALPDNIKVMVIDDSKTIRRTAESILVDAGAKVVTASDGFEALARVAEHNPDIIIVDIMMPRLDGYQVCALIKHNVNYRHIPVVVLSSKDSIFDKARGRLVGADSYLTKPFQREDLLVTIRKHLVQRAEPASA
ncbi:MAG: response regulator [Pseudomonadota bacterium]